LRQRVIEIGRRFGAGEQTESRGPTSQITYLPMPNGSLEVEEQDLTPPWPKPRTRRASTPEELAEYKACHPRWRAGRETDDPYDDPLEGEEGETPDD
jgi:hypothetical protein